MASSTVPAFKARLKTNLLGRAGLTGVQVTHGPPLPVPEPEFIWLADAKGTQDFMTAAAQRDEEYDLTIWIHVVTNSTPDDFKTAGDRAFALMAEIENELRGDRTVSGTVMQAHLTDFVFLEHGSAESQEAQIEITVHVKALI
jgi:hypothetical protein